MRRFLFWLHYQLFSVKRSSRRSERKRSGRLLERSERFRASILCFCLNRISGLMPLVAPNAAFTLSALRRKGCYAALLLLFRPKAQRRRKCRLYAFLLTEEKLLYGITPPPPKKSTSALAREKLSLRSVFHGLLDYRFFSAMRSSLRSERRRSKPLLERSGKL